MPELTQIKVWIATSRHEDAGTTGRVYLGICGREFRCERGASDFKSGYTTEFVFGEDATIMHAAANNPRDPRLFTEEIDEFPIYVRFEQGASDHWALASVLVQVNGAEHPVYERRFSPAAALWLGEDAGACCYLRVNNEVPYVGSTIHNPGVR